MLTEDTRVDPSSFAQAMRERYPGAYDGMKDDYALSRAIVETHPQYADKVDFGPQAPPPQEDIVSRGIDALQSGISKVLSPVGGFINKNADQLPGPISPIADGLKQLQNGMLWLDQKAGGTGDLESANTPLALLAKQLPTNPAAVVGSAALMTAPEALGGIVGAADEGVGAIAKGSSLTPEVDLVPRQQLGSALSDAVERAKYNDKDVIAFGLREQALQRRLATIDPELPEELDSMKEARQDSFAARTIKGQATSETVEKARTADEIAQGIKDRIEQVKQLREAHPAPDQDEDLDTALYSKPDPMDEFDGYRDDWKALRDKYDPLDKVIDQSGRNLKGQLVTPETIPEALTKQESIVDRAKEVLGPDSEEFKQLQAYKIKDILNRIRTHYSPAELDKELSGEPIQHLLGPEQIEDLKTIKASPHADPAIDLMQAHGIDTDYSTRLQKMGDWLRTHQKAATAVGVSAGSALGAYEAYKVIGSLGHGKK